jgi:Holliday junction DNA helicase RuvB
MSNNVRPKKLSDFLGQSHIVEQVDIAVKASVAQDQPFPHMAMGGPPGLGKTTLAAIIANEINGVLVSRIASAIKTPEDLLRLFTEINQLNTIIFLDEIEQLDRKLTELLHTALEDGTFSAKLSDGSSVNMTLPEFTMIGATNYLGELPRPFLDRFRIQVNFEPYSTEEIYSIVVGAVRKLKYKVTEDAAREISLRSRGVPRIAIRFLENADDVSVAKPEFNGVTRACVMKMFEVHRIDHMGLTDLDRRVLTYLMESGKPVGLKTLSQGVDEDDSTVELSEGYLVRSGLVQKGARGREITERGVAHLKEVEECQTS